MNNNRINFSSGAIWEDIVGYSRAVKVDNNIFVSGTTATDKDGNIIGDNYYSQTKQIIKNIESALKKAESSLSDIVRIRIYVLDISKWEEVGKALGESFKSIKPAATMVEVSKLISPEILVEIEADAYLIK